MKNLHLSMVSALVMGLSCSNAFALDGTITVNGIVTDQTCTLTGSGAGTSGTQNIVVTLDTVPKSTFTAGSLTAAKKEFTLELKNGAGTAGCDAATNKGFKGIHLATAAPASDLDTTDKTLLINKATGTGGASTTNPVFVQILTNNDTLVDFTQAWGAQAKSAITGIQADGSGIPTMIYKAQYASKTGSVDAQNVTAVVNYTLEYN